MRLSPWLTINTPSAIAMAARRSILVVDDAAHVLHADGAAAAATLTSQTVTGTRIITLRHPKLGGQPPSLSLDGRRSAC